MDDNLQKNAAPIDKNELAKILVEFMLSDTMRKNKEFKTIPAMSLISYIEEILNDNPDLSVTANKTNAQKIFKILKEKYFYKDLERLNSVIPKNHIKPNNKLANTITKSLVEESEIDLIISDRKAKKEVTTKVMLNYDNKNVQFESPLKFTAYDREVYDGVITLYEAGNNIITPVIVYRAMNGLTDTEYVSEKAVEEVKKSLDKSSRIRTIIDYTDEAKMYNKNIEKTVYEGYLLATDKLIVKVSGIEQEAYKLLRSPILYEYAQISGQIISVPINLLNTKDTVNSTDDVIVIRGYLLRQIEWMKSEKSNRSKNVTYQGIYDELGISKMDLEEKAYENKTKKIRNHVKSILNSWQAQNYIKSFEEYKDGRQLKGAKISFQNTPIAHPQKM